ncbi:T9SS type B sorting domain-containing protein [Winogradskyella sp. R77965]|uniref:T9SS type B sorting domain-containing protein n=1 Tax=Winogradskyella sp. R77965 TaxID=3093872 RepID=UPI0037DC95B0
MLIVTSATISDPNPEDTLLSEIFVQIAEGYVFGQDMLTLGGVHPNITSTWNASEALLTLSGPATFSEFEYAVENVFFQTTQMVFTQDRQFSINLSDANYLPSTGHYYIYEASVGITWVEARNLAASQTYFGLQGYLATITTEEESQLAGEQSAGTGWIGGSDSETEGTWKWVTGPEAGQVFWQGAVNGSAPNNAYSFWNTNEPNNLGEEDYAHITAPTVGILGSWNDLSNTGSTNPNSDYHPQGYIVEFGGMPNEPEINLSASSTILMPRLLSNNISLCGPSEITLAIEATTNDMWWYESSTSLVPIHTGLNYNVNISETTTYWLQPIVNGCINSAIKSPFTVTVNPIPNVIDIVINQCEDEVMDGISNFNLSAYNDVIVTDGLDNISVQFFETSDSVIPLNDENYSNQYNSQTIFALVTNTLTDCSITAEVLLSVNTNNPNSASLTVCDNLEETGLVNFDLTSANAQILNGESADISILGFYETYNKALLQEDQLGNSYTNIEPYNQTIFARLERNGDCYSIAEVHLIVELLPNLADNETVYYCLNEFPEKITLYGGIIDDTPNTYYYNWSTGETTMEIEVNEPGIYSVVVTKPFGCSNQRTITVLPSSTAIFETIEVTDVSENNSITVLVSGEGDYRYALDYENGVYQESNIFTNVSAGIRTVFVKDIKNNCGIVSEDISVLGFPKFFTPNGDGENDTWQISGFYPQFPITASITIFDRYGKLITILNENKPSWDGHYSGKLLPMDDYWFVARLADGRTFRGHFTLKR